MPGVPTLLWQESPDPELQGYGVGKVVRGDPGPTQGAVEFLLMCRMGLGMLDSGCPTSSRDTWPDDAKVLRDTQASGTDTWEASRDGHR